MPTYREGLAARECRFPAAETASDPSTHANYQALQVEACSASNVPESYRPELTLGGTHSSLAILGYGDAVSRNERSSSRGEDNAAEESHQETYAGQTAWVRRHQRRRSEPLSPTVNIFETSEPSAAGQRDPQASIQPRFFSLTSRALSDRRPKLPEAITTQFDFNRSKINAVNEEQFELARRYKVEVREEFDSDEKVLRSPKKKLFGEHGILGRTNDVKDLPDPRYKRPTLILLGEKLREFKDGVKTQLVDTIVAADQRWHSSSQAPTVSTFPISLSIYVQGYFYMELEMMLTNEANAFILGQVSKGNVTVKSVEKIAKVWREKGRPQGMRNIRTRK